MSHSVARTTGRARLARLLAALCVPGLLTLAGGSGAAAAPEPVSSLAGGSSTAAAQGPVSSLAGGSGAAATLGPVSSTTYSAAVSFSDLEYSVSFVASLHPRNPVVEPAWRVATDPLFFGEVTTGEREDGLDLSFAVEGQPDPSGYRICKTQRTCNDVAVAVTPGGVLYLYQKELSSDYIVYAGDFPRLPVELSASDADSGLKVYREVMVGPPPAVSGCEDYSDNTPEAYTCIFLRELLPSEVTGVDEATLRTGLPGLVQADANYNLVFSEEFNGTPPDGTGCINNGLSTLDDALWSYLDPCVLVDSRGESCGDIADGALIIANAWRCYALVTTRGKVQAKYGYWEMKYTFNVDSWTGITNVSNYNIIMSGGGDDYHFDRYGVEIQGWEDYLTNKAVEIDIFEYIPGNRVDVAHQYGNWTSTYREDILIPIRSHKLSYYCSQNTISIITNPNACSSSDTFTVTRGIEWTPRGYRTFIKVDGLHDNLTVVPKDKIVVHTKPYRRTVLVLTGAARDRYFEYVDPADINTLLEQVVVSHVPLPIHANAWGNTNSRHPYIRTRMKIDYIRLWQPENHYTDMEPVYQ